MAPAKKGEGDDVAGILKAMYATSTQLALAPDAAQFPEIVQKLPQAMVQAIQAVTTKKAQMAAQQHQQMAQMASQGMGGPPPSGGAPPQPGQGPPMAMRGQPGGPPSQGSPGMAMPNPDELRRVLAEQGAGG